MSKKFLTSGLVALLAVCAFGTLTVGEASGATLKVKGAVAKEAFLAVYGFPAVTNEAERPVGGGLDRAFAAGQNMLFRATTKGGVGANLLFELPKAKVKSEACDSHIGGTLSSNHTGTNLPLAFQIQFADFQCNEIVGVAKSPAYTGFQQRQQQWHTVICAPVEKAECKVDAILKANAEGLVKIEGIAINIGPGIVVEGTAWGKWKNGEAKKAPCIELKTPTVEMAEKEPDQTLIVTQTNNEALAVVGEKVSKVGGTACLVSANNTWFSVEGLKEEPAIEITNE